MIRWITAKESTRHVAEHAHHPIATIQECATKEDAPAEKHKLHHIFDKLWSESSHLIDQDGDRSILGQQIHYEDVNWYTVRFSGELLSFMFL
jgi:hypothetical protein